MEAIKYRSSRFLPDNPASVMNVEESENICPGPHVLNSDKGMVLILTLLVLVIITALVVEFTYGVHTTTESLYNWKTLQRLSFVAKSGVSLAVKTISGRESLSAYTYPAKTEMPVNNILSGFEGSVLISSEDENSKLNLNSVLRVSDSYDSYESFKRLLRNLNLDESIAARVADWIDRDNEPRLRDSEDGAKNAYMDSVDELLLIHGIDKETYGKLMPYVTVYGMIGRNSVNININTASIPVIMSLNEDMTEDVAEWIVYRREEIAPFVETDIGNEPVLRPLSGWITVKATNFRIVIVTEENRIRRIIEAVVEIKSDSNTVKYWREI